MPYDVIFDFSASPVGGGLKRLVEYIKYFEQSNYKVLFLAHPATRGILEEFHDVEINYIKRPACRRIFDDASFVKRYRGKANCFFSYGIPIYHKMSDLDWLHISNALPFAYKDCTVNFLARIKNHLLFDKFKQNSTMPAVVSAESYFSLDLYSTKCMPPKESFILRNGVDSFIGPAGAKPVKESVMLCVGVEGYKRIRMVFREFKRLKSRLNLERLVIVGNPKKVDTDIISDPDVIATGYIQNEKLTSLYLTSKYFISASEIENSSVAVIEALKSGAICFLSKIPSHLEMFDTCKLDLADKDAGDGFFIVDMSKVKEEQIQTWKQVIESMCKRIDLSVPDPE